MSAADRERELDDLEEYRERLRAEARALRKKRDVAVYQRNEVQVRELDRTAQSLGVALSLSASDMQRRWRAFADAWRAENGWDPPKESGR